MFGRRTLCFSSWPPRLVADSDAALTLALGVVAGLRVTSSILRPRPIIHALAVPTSPSLQQTSSSPIMSVSQAAVYVHSYL